MSPAIDLNAILAPIITQVADLIFPSVVDIESPVITQDATGDPIVTWTVYEAGLPALIQMTQPGSSPRSARTNSMQDGIAPVDREYVSVLLAGAPYIAPDWRIADTVTGDRWDVEGVSYDPVRVTTTIVGLRVHPGTPPDAGS